MNKTRITEHDLLRIAARISEREFRVLETIDRLGLVTTGQIERLHFSPHSPQYRQRARQRAMKNLIHARTALALTRHMGGPQRWSGQPIYALDVAGDRLMRQRQGMSGYYRPPRRSLPALQLLDHVLDVAELYTRVSEASQAGAFDLAEGATEPASWWRTSTGKLIKPDAYLTLSAGGYFHHWWVEVDRGTESAPTVLRQLSAYISFATSGEPGPSDVIPRVLVTVPTTTRRTALRRALSDLPAIAEQLISITHFDAAVDLLTTHAHSGHRTNPSEKNEKGTHQ